MLYVREKKVKDDFKDYWRCFVEMGKNVGREIWWGRGKVYFSCLSGNSG